MVKVNGAGCARTWSPPSGYRLWRKSCRRFNAGFFNIIPMQVRGFKPSFVSQAAFNVGGFQNSKETELYAAIWRTERAFYEQQEISRFKQGYNDSSFWLPHLAQTWDVGGSWLVRNTWRGRCAFGRRRENRRNWRHEHCCCWKMLTGPCKSLKRRQRYPPPAGWKARPDRQVNSIKAKETTHRA